MLVCPECPRRSFTSVNALRMHRESKHDDSGYSCGQCNKAFSSEQALEQHARDKHISFECRYCDREFTTPNGRDAHEEAVHPTFECHYCDREFSSEDARQQHEDAKHPSMFECHYCDREFSSEDARQQHEDAKHSFECHYCDREFKSEDARQQHEDAKHSFECQYCDREFKSEDARQQHEDAKHSFECQYCDLEFRSEEARDQHEDVKHSTIECRFCSREFSSETAREQHENAKHFQMSFTQAQITPHLPCIYCGSKFSSSVYKFAHEVSCDFNPANIIVHKWFPSHSPLSSLSDHSALMGTIEEGPSPSTATQPSDEGSMPPSPRSSQDEGELFHSTSALPSTDANSEEATVTQSCTCAQPSSPDTCPKCQSSNAEKPAPDDTESVVSADDDQQDDSQDSHVIFRCTSCLELFDKEEAFRDHFCTFRATLLRLHCPVCYSQFDDVPSLQQHMEGPESFSCQLCLTRCCSDEMLQDHLLGHPTCSKCSKPFADNLALCAHVESDHPTVVCWDCDGIVIETNSLESHYADSSAHPTCAFCGVGKRNTADLDEHVKHVHITETEGQSGGCDVNASADLEESPMMEAQDPGVDRGKAAQSPLEELLCAPSSSGVDIGPPGELGEELHVTSLRTESSLYSSQPAMPPQVEPREEAARDPSGNGEGTPDVVIRQYASPSPTPSEHGSDASRHLHASKVTITATNNDTRPPSPVSSVSGGSFSDLSTESSPTSSASNSIVFVSADGIPDYIRENRAMLVATSAGSPSSGRTPLRLPSSSSLESLDMSGRGVEAARVATPIENRNEHVRASPTGTSTKYRLHCRICLRDPCDDMTATICGHLFCNRCITQAVVAKPECPVCKSATLLYCFFKLDLSV